MKTNGKLILTEKYVLEPLLHVEKDNISHFLSREVGVYICSFPSSEWLDYYNLKVSKNYSSQKKQRMFSLMKKGSFLFSPTEIDTDIYTPKKFSSNNILYLSSIFINSRLKQIDYSFKIIQEIWRVRNKISYVLYYNFGMPIFFTSLIVKYLFGKKIYVDFEDDSILLRSSNLKNVINKWLYLIPDYVICINQNMRKCFRPKTETHVFNGFIDMSYAKNLNFDFFENQVFLFAGTLDEIRGVDLIPSIVLELRKYINDFTILISGSGPLSNLITSYEYSEIKYLGFLNENEFENILKISDAFLVLQKPDHPFSKGSFPSKVEYYSKHKKPIYVLKEL